ncbi:MAG: cupredoxin domain-containing protein [Myxococcota bacterium]|nr:cupredoxin domain-containing protein [Myxococcota bacterium]
MRILSSVLLSLTLSLITSVTLADPPRRFEITVDERGYHPGSVEVERGERITLVFTRTSERGCGGTLVIPSHDIRRELPVGERVAVTLDVGDRDRVAFTCGMGMYRGALVVR